MPPCNMAHLGPEEYVPAVRDRAAWDEGYAIYRELHDSMAQQTSVMRRLRAQQARARAAGTVTGTMGGSV